MESIVGSGCPRSGCLRLGRSSAGCPDRRTLLRVGVNACSRWWSSPSPPSVFRSLLVVVAVLGWAGKCRCVEPAAAASRGPVLVHEPPNHVDFSNTTGRRVDCVSSGSPPPVVEWLHSDGSRVATAASHVPRLRQALANGSLLFAPFRADEYRQDVHAAVYRCLASNVLGAVLSREVKVRAVVKQLYEVQVYDEFVIQGNTAVLKCHIPSFVHDYVTVRAWRRETGGKSETVVENGNRYSIFTNGVLHIRNVVPSDGRSSYRCQTQHLLTGEIKLSTSAGRLVISEPKSSVPPRITHSRSVVEERRNARAELPCAAQGFPLPTYSWQRVKESLLVPVSLNERVQQLSGTLIFQDLVQDDGGTYICFVNNTVGFERVETTLSVIAPLSAYIQPEMQTVDEGKPASLACSVTGFPVAFISWIKDGKHLIMNERVRLVSREVLHIEAVERDDRGMYQCLARNDHSSTQASAELKLGAAPPVFSSVFSEQTLQPGVAVSLHCAVSGSPVPQVTWTLDDAPVPVLNRFELVEYVSLRGDVVSYVNITKALTEDGGNYRCIASNAVGKVEHAARLNIFGAPLVRPMRNTSEVAGSTLILHCRVVGYPIHIVRWERAGNILPTNHRQSVYPNGTLVVHNVQQTSDAGAYTCVVANKQNMVSKMTTYVSILNAPVINPFFFPNNLREGVRAGIQCLVIEGDQPMTISWLKDDKTIVNHLGVVTKNIDEFTSSLVINNIMPKHTGNYTCIAKNSVASVRYTASLLVNVAPQWVVEPKDTALVLHSSLRLDCQVNGSPKPSISWKKAIGEVPVKYKLVTVLGLNAVVAENGSLFVKSVLETHEGHYVCQASNGVGAELSKVIFVNVHVPAHFENKMKNHTAIKGSSMSLICEAHGDVPIDVVWKYKGNKIEFQSDSRFKVKEKSEFGSLVSELTISTVNRSDNGQYGCLATNTFGRDESKIMVYVKEPPEAPKRVKSIDVGSRYVKILWTPSYDGNSPVIKFIIQFKSNSDVWQLHGQNKSVSGRQSQAEIDGLRPAISYQFRVLAQNEIGIGKPSSSVTVTTNEEAPSGIPKEIQVDPISSRSLRVRWKPPQQELWNGVLQGYHLGYREVSSSDPLTLVTVAHKSTLDFFEHELKMLKKFTEYGIVVEAFNSVGSGPSSKEVSTFTLEDVPSEPPQNVQCSTASSRNIRVTWTMPITSSIHGVLQGYSITYSPYVTAEGESKTITTSQMQIELQGLEKYTNYSIKVAAFNRAGQGTSSFCYCLTDEDVPNSPADVKALVMSADAVIVSWRPPTKPNGVLTKYSVYMRDLGGPDSRAIIYPLSPAQTHYEVRGLKEGFHYEFWVTASTSVGEGEKSKVVSQSPISTVPASIASFPEQFLLKRKDDVKLPCKAVGIPTPDREWRGKQHKIQENTRTLMTSDGSLSITNLRHSDTGNYTCRVFNIYATDEISHEVFIKGPAVKEAIPSAPEILVTVRTTDSLTIKWNVNDDGGDTINEYTLYYKKDGQNWEQETISSGIFTFTLKGLLCGSQYHMYMTARNNVGVSEVSSSKSTNTKGSKPEIPAQENLLRANTSFVVLDLSSWIDGGCPIRYFVIEYKPKDEADWSLIPNNVERADEKVVIDRLSAGVWYRIRVSAFNDAGSSTVEYDIQTGMAPIDKSQPDVSLESNSLHISQILDVHFVLPIVLIGCVLFLGLAIVGIIFHCRRTRFLKENAVALRSHSETPARSTEHGKHLTGNNSVAFTSFHSTIHKQDSSASTDFGHYTCDQNDLSPDISSYATLQVSSRLIDDPANLQLRTFSQNIYQNEYDSLGNVSISKHVNTKYIYTKPVKPFHSSEEEGLKIPISSRMS